MSISESIRFFRKEAGLTQKDLARKCGLAEITIRQYESGKREPRSSQLAKIAGALKLSEADLYLGQRIEYTDLRALDEGFRNRLRAYENIRHVPLPEDQKIRTDLLIMGEILVEIMRDREDVPLGQTGTFKGPYPSGAPAICIDAAARLGCNTVLVGSVGRDDFGKLVINRLESGGVDCRCITQTDRHSTGCAFVTYFKDGSRRFIFHMGASVHAAAPAPAQFGKVKYMHIMGCSLMADPYLAQGILDTMHTLSEAGTKISFDPNIRKELYQTAEIKEIFADVLMHTNILLPGKEELLLITGENDVGSAVRKCFENPGLEMLVLKDGSRGSRLYTRCAPDPDTAESTDELKVCQIDAYKIEQKDPTGAGDCFDGAFLAGLIRGETPETAAQMGAAAGALNAMAFGPMEGKIDPETIYKIIETGNIASP
ncbi:MAG TPA: helix-turn-helix domain-containing protein [Candidatus Mediterraneibacter faecavium]|uniref:Helix-turn-helix domain-containing protein n=1 Tax=Candidatus Mediterraneibacter faecavium TaxID=2838668 RepID=A0A9D2QA37_9FIRM|nr:helix-turn-helix domain-containing protein [Candidatus Mediterraneibacter faecavium]